MRDRILFVDEEAFIPSGHADSDLILERVGSTHQYLAKPCDADRPNN